MTLFFHELKRGKISLIIWSSIIAFLLAVCVFIYPEMAEQMGELEDMFNNMGSFSDAFGMEALTEGGFLGFFSLECAEMLGIGGALFAAILGIGMLSKEEQDGTAEFLLSHPISRSRVVTEKLLAVVAEILIFNIVQIVVTALSIIAISEEVDVGKLALIFLSFLILHLEVAVISFGISSALRCGGIGIGLGIALLFYFVSLASGISESLEFLKYLTPFSYTSGSYIIEHTSLEWKYVIIGAVVSVASVACAYRIYTKKDIT